MCSSSNDESPVRSNTTDSSPLQGRAGSPSQLQHHMVYDCTSTPSTNDPYLDATAEEENFPTPPLDDDIWLKDPA